MIYGNHVGYASEENEGPEFEDDDSYFGNITPERKRREKAEIAEKAKKLIEKKSKKKIKIHVACYECGKRFLTTSMLPACPKCGGSDIDIR